MADEANPKPAAVLFAGLCQLGSCGHHCQDCVVCVVGVVMTFAEVLEEMKRILGKRTPDYPGVMSPVNLAGPIHQYYQQYQQRAEAPEVAPWECEICHKTIENRNEVVCVYTAEENKYHPAMINFGIPANKWCKLLCSSQCAHALLNTHLVTWRLKGLFGDPKEEEDYY